MDSDSDDGTIIPESAPSSPTSPPMLTGLHLYRCKQKQLMEIHVQRNKGYDGESSSDESEPSQSILKPKSLTMYRSPIFSPPLSKTAKFSGTTDVLANDKVHVKLFNDEINDSNTFKKQPNETEDCDSDCTEIEGDRNYINSQILQVMPEASQRNSEEMHVIESEKSKVLLRNFPQLEVDTTEITGLDTSVSNEPQLSRDTPAIRGLDTSVLNEPQLSRDSPEMVGLDKSDCKAPQLENTKAITGLDKSVSKVPQLEDDTLEITRLGMPIWNTGSPQSAKLVEQDSLDMAGADKDSKDRELRTVVTEEMTLRKVKGSEDVLNYDENSENTQNDISWEVDKEHSELMELETKLKKLKGGEEPGMNCKLLSIKMQLKLLNESFKKKRAKVISKLEKLQRVSSKNRQQQELENINSKQKILLKLVKIYRNISNEISNPLTPDGKRSVERMSQSKKRLNQLRSVKNTEREKQGLSKRKSTEVDLNLVVKKLISSGLVTSAESSELTSEYGENTQEVSNNAGHLSSSIASGNSPLVVTSTTYDSVLNPIQKNMSYEKDTTERISEMPSAVGDSVINQHLNKVATNSSAQNEQYHKPAHDQLMLANMKIVDNEIREVVLLNPSNVVGNNIYTATHVFHHQPVPSGSPVMLIEAPRCKSVCNSTTQNYTTSKHTIPLQQAKKSKINAPSTVPISIMPSFANTPSSFSTAVPSTGVVTKNKSLVSLTNKSKRGSHGVTVKNKTSLPDTSKNNISATFPNLPQSISQPSDSPTTTSSSSPVPYIDRQLNQPPVTEIRNDRDAVSQNQTLLKPAHTCKPSMFTVTSPAVTSLSSCHSTFDTSRSLTPVTSASTISGSMTTANQTSDDTELQKRLRNCRIFLIENNELFPSKLYLPDKFWTNKFGSIDLPASLMKDIDNWN